MHLWHRYFHVAVDVPIIVSFPDHFSHAEGKNSLSERDIPFSFLAVAKMVT